MRINKNDTIRVIQPKYDNWATAVENKYIIDENLSDEEFRIVCFVFSINGRKSVNLDYLAERLNKDINEINVIVNNLVVKEYLEKSSS